MISFEISLTGFMQYSEKGNSIKSKKKNKQTHSREKTYFEINYIYKSENSSDKISVNCAFCNWFEA